MRRHPAPGRRQSGAALAVALVLLVVLTLLGVAAVRATQTELRLSQNAESRSAARQAAESLISTILADPENTPVSEQADFRACYLPEDDAPAAAAFSCTDGDRDRAIQVIPDSASGETQAKVPDLVAAHGYAEVVRQLPLFVSVEVMREAQTSGRAYDFARYAITAGFDRSDSGQSAAEVTEGRLVLHNRVAGVNYE